jgi:hypothetical protein
MSYHSLIFNQYLIIFRNSNQENNRGDVFKAVNPLLSFGTLTTYIEHTIGQVTNNKRGFSDTSSLDARSKDILITWSVLRMANAIYGIKVAVRGAISKLVVNMKTAGSGEENTHYWAESLS